MKMLLHCGLMLMLATNVFAKDDPRVVKIRQWYSEIEGSKKLKSQSFSTGEEAAPEMMKLTRYVDGGGDVRKLYVVYGSDHGESRTSYYFKKGKLFFVFESSNHWRFTGKKTASGESEVMDIARESRLYFDGGECIKALGKKVELIGGDELNTLLKQKKNEEFEPVAAMNDYLKSAAQLVKIISKKDLLAYVNR